MVNRGLFCDLDDELQQHAAGDVLTSLAVEHDKRNVVDDHPADVADLDVLARMGVVDTPVWILPDDPGVFILFFIFLVHDLRSLLKS